MIDRRRALALLLIAWSLGTVGAAVALERHAAEPGADTNPALRWPADTALTRAPEGSTLVCFLHARCPCARATVRELERLLSTVRAGDARVRTALAVKLVFTHYDPVDPARSTLWAMASQVPGAELFRDANGVEAARFGAQTSGVVLLYRRNGALAFHGGITPARGREGPSQGAQALAARIFSEPRTPDDGDDPMARPPAASSMPSGRVFGCGLLGGAS